MTITLKNDKDAHVITILVWVEALTSYFYSKLIKMYGNNYFSKIWKTVGLTE